MNAKEMFEKLGYTYQESYFNNSLNEIRYISPRKFASVVIFVLNNNCFKICRRDDEYKSAWCDKKILQAINKQVEELWWNNE